MRDKKDDKRGLEVCNQYLLSAATTRKQNKKNEKVKNNQHQPISTLCCCHNQKTCQNIKQSRKVQGVPKMVLTEYSGNYWEAKVVGHLEQSWLFLSFWSILGILRNCVKLLAFWAFSVSYFFWGHPVAVTGPSCWKALLQHLAENFQMDFFDIKKFSMTSSSCGHRNFKGFKSILNYRFVRVLILGAVY